MDFIFRRILLMIIFTFILIKYIQKDDYLSIFGLLFLTLYIDHNLGKNVLIEGIEPNTETPAADEETPAADEETPETDEETPAADEETPETDEETPATDEDQEDVDLNELPSSNDNNFKINNQQVMNVIDNKFRMGPYDSLCLSSDELQDPGYIDNEELKTYFGVQGPVQIVSAQNDDLKGPTIDGNIESPQKLTMFANNKTSFNCCHESPFMSSAGCICLTEKQREFIRTRGFNNIGVSNL